MENGLVFSGWSLGPGKPSQAGEHMLDCPDGERKVPLAERDRLQTNIGSPLGRGRM
jgi:hypothetical protein